MSLCVSSYNKPGNMRGEFQKLDYDVYVNKNSCHFQKNWVVGESVELELLLQLCEESYFHVDYKLIPVF